MGPVAVKVVLRDDFLEVENTVWEFHYSSCIFGKRGAKEGLVGLNRHDPNRCIIVVVFLRPVQQQHFPLRHPSYYLKSS
jgi:hypothetical protein